ncbi:TLD-domain-containing protein [Gaertneriomyces semiglobifer]|nr:TLD-domain-containing protein [Gaertneriomyces semiglobifer]
MYAKILGVNKLAEYEKNYEMALRRTYGSTVPSDPLPPTFGGKMNLIKVALNPAGFNVVEHILCALAHDFPTLEYSPFLPACLVLLAHHMRNEDELLGAIVCILKRSLGRDGSASPMSPITPNSNSPLEEWHYFPTYRKGVKLMLRAFGNLLYKTNKKLHAHLIRLHDKAPDPVWAGWLTGLLIEVLPQPVLWRFLDCFVLEGYRALFRFTIAALQVQRDAVLQQTELQGVIPLFHWQHPALASVAAICKAADAVDAAQTETRKLQEHHQSLSAISDNDIAETQFRFQRGLPKIVGNAEKHSSGSTVLKDMHWIALWSWIPPSKRVEALELVFTTREHGTHTNNLFNRAADRAPLIILVETTEGAVFGAYLSHPFPGPGENRGEWYGNGETFLFTLEPSAKLFAWVGRTYQIEDNPDNGELADPTVPRITNAPTAQYIRDRASMFIMISRKEIHIGGGGGGVGLILNETLTGGETGMCQTFENQLLTGTKKRYFDCHVVEVFAFN